jgi:hypothetical protein
MNEEHMYEIISDEIDEYMLVSMDKYKLHPLQIFAIILARMTAGANVMGDKKEFAELLNHAKNTILSEDSEVLH